VATLRRDRRPVCRCCIDWSERRPHLAGAVGARLAASAFASGWVERLGDTRGVRLTQSGRSVFRDALGLGRERADAA
jgi:hypothetical protein